MPGIPFTLAINEGDEKGNVIYTEQVAETTEEPNYKAALEALMN